MQRDMELVRRILLAVRDRNDVQPDVLELDGCERLVLDRHIEMLHQAGMVEGIRNRTHQMPVAQIMVTDLSWEGHDFLAALDNQGVWSKLKASFSAAELAGLPLSVLKDAGVALLKQYTMEKLGLS